MTRIKTVAAAALVASAAFASAAPAFAVVPGSDYGQDRQQEQARLAVVQGTTARDGTSGSLAGTAATFGYSEAGRASDAPLNNRFFDKQREEADRESVVTGTSR